MLDHYRAKNIKDYLTRGPRNESLTLYFTFNTREEAMAYYQFIGGDRSRYNRERNITSSLTSYFLKPGKYLMLANSSRERSC